MKYQPVFVKITDKNGSVQSHSCREKIEWVEGFLDTDIGKIGDFRLFVNRKEVRGPKGGHYGEKTVMAKLILNYSKDAEAIIKNGQVIITLSDETKQKREFVRNLGE